MSFRAFPRHAPLFSSAVAVLAAFSGVQAQARTVSVPQLHLPVSWMAPEAMAFAPITADWREAGQVRHGFTHFELIIDLFAARVPRIAADGLLRPLIRPLASLGEEALPSVMRKCVRMAAPGTYNGGN